MSSLDDLSFGLYERLLTIGLRAKLLRIDPARDSTRFDRAVAAGRGDSIEPPLLFLDVEPWPHQRDMLEALAVDWSRREMRGTAGGKAGARP